VCFKKFLNYFRGTIFVINANLREAVKPIKENTVNITYT